jgi:hypothetical protein
MVQRLVGVACVVGSILLLAPPALAETAPAEHDSGPAWSITFSPIHLIAGPIAEVTAEGKLGRKLGAAVMLGAGKFTDRSNAGVDNTFDVFEVGASVRGYLLGSFERGLQLGASLEYATLSGDDVNASGVSAVGNGLSASPFIGYKHVWSMGLTFDGQVGPSFVAIRAEGGGSTAEDSRVGLNLNLNLGWSF